MSSIEQAQVSAANSASRPSFIGSIATIYVPVSDFWKSKKWYESVLGLEWGGHCFLLDSGPTLFLCETKDHAKPHFNFTEREGYEMFVVTFQTKTYEQLLDFHVYLQQNGVKVEDIEDRGLCGRNFKFYDPDGNKFDVWNGDYRHETAPQWVEPE